MRRAILPMLAVAATAAVLTSISPAPAQAQRGGGGQLFCDAFNRCVPTSEQSYNACYTLAMQRGWNMTVTDFKGRNSFIYQCLTGRVR